MVRSLVCVVVLVLSCTSAQGQCPSIPQCECTDWSQTVTCTNIGSSLTSVLPKIPSSTRTLHITGTSIYRLQEQDLDQISSNNIDELYITNSQIQEITTNAFKKFPSLRKLHLNQNQINAISDQAFVGLGSLQTLDLSHNRLALLNTDVFKSLSSLRELYLNKNQLTELPQGLFASQRSLQVLSLDGNGVSSLKGSSFQGVQSLGKLYASRCGLRVVDEEFFAKASMIETLDLSYNSLTDVPGNGKLNLLRHLRNLTLQGNMISVLPASVFQGLNLDVLDLSKNGIANLQSNTFMYLGSVRYLDLSFNNIISLPENVFQPISSQLYSLKLNNNRKLAQIPKNLLNGMQMLQDLNLSFCSLTDLPETFFANVFSLQKVDISNNRITFISQSFLSKATQMTQLRISNNPWICDCYIKPLRDWLHYSRNSEVIHCTENVQGGFNRNCASQQCSAPQRLLYRDIYTLQDPEIPTCENLDESASAPTEIIIGVVVGIVVCVFIIIIVIILVCRRHKKGQPLLCGTDKSHAKKRKKKDHKINDYYREKKEKRQIDPDRESMNESDKGFVVRNYFHSMDPDVDETSMGTQSMTRRGSQESLSHSGYAYGSQAGSRNSSQYSLNSGYRFESAV